MPPPDNLRKKASLNPFANFISGNKNLFSTNFSAVLGACAVSILGGFIIVVVALLMLRTSVNNVANNQGYSPLLKLLLEVIAYCLIAALVNGYFYELLARAIVTGSRREHTSFGSLFSFVGRRYFLAVRTALFIYGVGAGVIGAIFLAIHVQPIAGALLGLIGAIFLIVFAFRMSYAFFVVVDDQPPASAGAVLKRSSQLWKKSGGALVIYIVTLVAVIFLLEVIVGALKTGSSTAGTSTTYSTETIKPVAYATLLIISLIEGIFGLFFSAGVGLIYNQARQIVDGGMAPQSPSPGQPGGQSPMVTALPTSPYQPNLPPSPQPMASPQPPPASSPQSASPPSYQEPSQPFPAPAAPPPAPKISVPPQALPPPPPSPHPEQAPLSPPPPPQSL